MKILMVAIPNHHFFQWVNQLKNSGHDVYWFDVTDGGPKSYKIEWVTQIKGWRLQWDFPFRSTIKKRVPKLYKFIQKYNENSVAKAFQQAFDSIQPDVVHCFEMQLSGLPILPILEQTKVTLIYSSWGSDVFYYKQRGVNPDSVQQFMQRVDIHISDCQRDINILKDLGYAKSSYVLPGNGGLKIKKNHIKKTTERTNIIFKGYQYDVGEAIQIVKALEIVSASLLKNYAIHCYSADAKVIDFMKQSAVFKSLDYIIHPRHQRLDNSDLLKIMGNSVIHLGNNLSDGMPNALLEAMAMGAFPIQSNPGGATEEVITHGKNGFLITDPLNPNEIAKHIETALNNQTLRQEAQDFNVYLMQNQYNRATLQPKIQALYQNVFNNHH